MTSKASTLLVQPLETIQAKYLGEAPLYFRDGTMDIDPKRGLSLHGPVDATDEVQTIRVGVVSDSEGIQNVTSLFSHINEKPVRSSGDQPFTTLSFPGFVRAYNARLIFSDRFNEKLLSREISRLVGIENPNKRIRKVADTYGRKLSSICDRVVVPDVVICHKPEDIEATCDDRQGRGLTRRERERAEEIRKRVETHMVLAPLDQDTIDFIQMVVRADFRRMLKVASIRAGVPVQILRQSTLETMNYATKIPTIPAVRHRKEDPSTIAWNLSVAMYYKANHFPWRVGNLGPGSCYIGIAFYYDQTTHEKNMLASLAQIFTDTGEGMIVRGDSFHWDTEKRGRPRLTEESAHDLLKSALDLYKKHHNDQPPNRTVIHKTSKYGEDEIKGFKNASGEVPRYDYVTLAHGRDVFFYRNGDNPVLRSTFIPMLGGSYLLYTCGYVPYLKSYYGPRVPRPLEISERHGDTPPEGLAVETIALTRLDWNTTRYSIHAPITVRFARKVGEILGLVPQEERIQHQYRYYM